MSISEVEKMVKLLQEKHGSSYSVEKLNVWAHMLHIEKHNSYDEPPNVPYFTKSQKTPLARADISEESLSTSAPTSSSPSKHVSVRSECIDQLKRWHNLLSEGIISQDVIIKFRELF